MDTTEKLGLRMPELTDAADVADINYNSQILDEEISKRIKRVNGAEADEDGAVQIDEVPFARQIVSDIGQQSSDAYTARTTGGDASLSDGNATLVAVFGRRTHEGYTSESLQMSVTPAARSGGAEPITAEIDKDTFTGYVSESGTIVLSYTDAWSANPTLYGVTVTGTPISGDVITIVYVKEDRGLIRVSTPTALRSTGWNLYNHSEGYARVVRYSDTYGFIIGGSYTGIQFSATVDGSRTNLPVSGGGFTVPSDGYVWVDGGNQTDTYVLMTWSDWANGYDGEFQAYTESEIDLAGAMADFPYGLMQVGGVSDEINLSMQQSISRIERLGYSAATLESVKASGREYECDRSYIYVVREAPVTRTISLEQTYTVSDHGMEFIDGTEVAPLVQSLYGQNLVDKLRQEVVAVTPQSFSATQKSRARQNIGAAEDATVIKTINHKYPDSYGDITIIEGAGDAELGSYRVNVTIPVSAWVTGDGVYTATFSDPLIAANMDGVETWLDDPEAMLGETTFSTTDGMLTVTTTVKPTAAWNLHVVLATNGANVLSIANTKANKNTIAYVEDEDTAYHNIAAGEYLIWKEELYTANTAIPVGDTITGKVTRIDKGGLNAVADAVKASTAKSIGTVAKASAITSWIMASSELIKVGDMIHASARAYTSDSSAHVVSTNTAFVIPEGFRPSQDIFVSGYVAVDSIGFVPILAKITTTGLVQMTYSQSYNANQFAFYGTWSVL